ncbi:hemerythrin domain-containing protein [Streptomyces sp. NPDC048389]|uniref:hemerythrin domain-containing protein n=1 Tax=Streptomyces sp. NPDC048389 TaxID=3154622 RepID=UPI0034528045
MGHEADIIQELTADHRAVQRLFDRVRAAAPGSHARKQLVEQATIELVRHSTVEKEYLYPAVRKHVVDGDQWADKELADHAEVEKVLQALDGLAPDDDRFVPLTLSLMTLVTDHVRDEEQRLFPRLQALCPADLLRHLGEQVRTAGKATPTRPRPHALDSPRANKVTAPPLSMWDSLRDALSGRGRRR